MATNLHPEAQLDARYVDAGHPCKSIPGLRPGPETLHDSAKLGRFSMLWKALGQDRGCHRWPRDTRPSRAGRSLGAHCEARKGQIGVGMVAKVS